MGKTSIQWTDFSFNPWIGCNKVSPGCKNCYAESYDKRVGGAPVSQRVDGKTQLRWGVGAPRTRTSVNYWKQPIAWNAAALRIGERHRVFCASLADVFDAEVSDVWRLELFDLIRRTPQLDWLLLTKRPENIPRLLQRAVDAFPRAGDARLETEEMVQAWLDGTPVPNIWLGTTVEDQQRAKERIPHLIATPAVVHFLSCEPLLEQLDLSDWLDEDKTGFIGLIDWIIIGGESGAGARPFNLGWAVDLVNQCRDGGRAEASPFVKQLGARPVDAVGEPIRLLDHHGGDWDEWPSGLRVREYPTPRSA